MLDELAVGERFQFSYGGPWYVYRGNGWYMSEQPGSGGPWYTSPHATVVTEAEAGQMRWHRPSGVCSEACLRKGQGW